MNTLGRFFFLVLFSALDIAVQAQQFQIGIVDYFGLRSKGAPSKASVDGCLQFTKGDTVDVSSIKTSPAVECLARIPGVKQANIGLICCTEDNKLMLFVGVTGVEEMHSKTILNKDLTLPPEIISAYDTLMNGLMEAITSGQAEEDDQEGHALFHYPGAEAQQMKFIAFANEHLSELRNVLRHARDEKHRIVASWVIVYHRDKVAIVPDLTASAEDPDSEVRNNVMRGLGIIVEHFDRKEIKVSIDPSPYINLMNSVDWTDRNKSAFLLEKLTRKRDPDLLESLKKRALLPLADMAAWQSLGHAYPGIIILGRIAGLTDQQIMQTAQEDRVKWVDEIVAKLEKP